MINQEGDPAKQPETVEQIDWREWRRITLRRMAEPISDIAREEARVKEEKEKRRKANLSDDPELWRLEKTLAELFRGIMYANDLTIGHYSCQCRRCAISSLKMQPPDKDCLPGNIVRFRKDIHQKASKAEPPIRTGQWVKVVDPYIADNLLQEVVQPIRVMALSQIQPGRRYRPQYLRRGPAGTSSLTTH